MPPVHFNRFNYDRTQVVGEAVTQRPIPSHTTKGQKAVVRENEVREDRSQERLLHCFKKFAAQRNQVMFVLSQLSFTGYLGEPSYAAAAVKKLPRPIDLKAKDFDRGDFDILFIHRDFGLVAAEVKCIGDLFAGDASSQPSEDKALAKRIEQAVKQMDKSDEVLKHLTSDLDRKPSVTKTLMLPNIPRCQLRRVLLGLPKTKEVNDYVDELRHSGVFSMFVNVRVRLQAGARTHTHERTHAHTHTHTNTRTYTHTHTHACTHAYTQYAHAHVSNTYFLKLEKNRDASIRNQIIRLNKNKGASS